MCIYIYIDMHIYIYTYKYIYVYVHLFRIIAPFTAPSTPCRLLRREGVPNHESARDRRQILKDRRPASDTRSLPWKVHEISMAYPLVMTFIIQ